MRLYIVQHGDAVPRDVDPARPLSEQGRADIQRLADYLSEHEIEIAQIFHSGKTRAKETAEILGDVLTSPGQIDERAAGPCEREDEDQQAARMVASGLACRPLSQSSAC